MLGHYDNLGRISDLEKVIARQREAIIFTPLKSADRPLMLTILGDSYRSRYERFRDVKDIDSAIRQQSIALASIPRDSPHRPAILLNFGVAYLRRLERVAERKHFDFPINRMLDAVTSITTASSGSLKNVERLGLLRTLGNFYLLCFKLFGDINDLDPAIEQLQKAASIPLDIPDPSIHKILGNSYCTRFVWFSAIKDIESAIEQLLKAAASVPRNSILYPDIMHSLGNSYRCRFEWFGNKPDLESAMKHLHEAAASIPLIDPGRPRLLNDLASSYHCRFVRFGRKEDIDSVIKQQLELITSIFPPDNPEKANFLMFSGSCYLKRFEHFGEANDLDSAINQNLKAFKLASTLPNSPQDVFLHELGVSYQHRFRHSGHVKDIDSAIDLILKAVASTPLDNPKRPGYLASLGISYSERFRRFGEVKDIDLAIKQHLEAVGCTSTSLANRAAVHNNMALSHLMRFNHYGEKKDVDLSTKLVLEAAPSTPLDSPLRPKLAEKLGMSYAHRFTHSGDVKDSDLAIKEMLEAVASASPAYRLGSINNLGTIYLYRFQFFNEVKDIDVAIEIFVEALAAAPPDSPDRTSSLNNLGVSYLFRYRSNHEPSDLEKSIANFHLSSLSHGMPSMRIRGSLEWARLSHQFDDLVSASKGYDQAIRLLPRVTWIGLNAIAQLKELSSDIQMLGCNAAACMIALAEAATEHHNRQHHLGRAIELLDQGRSILWSQTSNFKRDLEDLRKVDRDLANDLDNVGKFLAQSCFRDPNDPLSETDAQLYRRNAEKWESLVHRIRGLPDFHQFLLPSPISILRTAAAEGPVVIINSSEYRCDAVIIPSQLEGDLVLVPLPNITAEELKSLTNQQEELASRKSKSVWIQSQDYSMPSETLEEVLNQTWLLIGEPIVEQLGLLRGSKGSSKSRVWWCLTGSLSFLPIHASCPPTKPGIGMMDIVISSYTPTVSTLLRARQRNKLKRPTLRMLAVGQSNIAGMTPLPGVTEEIAFIKKKLGAKALTLDESKATVDEVAASLPTCSWAHFACHGVQGSDKPMDSGLMMWDRHLLTLSRLAQSSLGSPEFAFLSCCESAKGSKQFPNEAMHLAAGLQFIGYRGVIGTMWSVGDKDALGVAKHIYGELFKDGTSRVSASKAALALHQAVLLLRSNNVPLTRWVPFVHFGL